MKNQTEPQWEKVNQSWYASVCETDVHVDAGEDGYCVKVYRNGDQARSPRYFESFVSAARNALGLVKSLHMAIADTDKFVRS